MKTRSVTQLLVVLCLCSLGSLHNAAAQTDQDWRPYPSTEWPLAGGHWGNTRHSTLDQITTENIADLGGRWTTELDGEVSKATAVVTGGLMFISTSTSIRALDARTGEPRWSYRAALGRLKGVDRIEPTHKLV